MIKKILYYSLIPFMEIGKISYQKKFNKLKIGLLICLTFILTLTFYGSLYISFFDNSKKEILQSRENEINDLKKKIIKSNNEIIYLTEKIEKTQDQKEKNKEIIENKETKEYIFTSGNYLSGKDFPGGIYNIYCLEGSSGNVISSNQFFGGINAVMGMNYGEKSYMNIKLPNQTDLKIYSLKIKLEKVD